MFYNIEGTLPHLTRTQDFIRELEQQDEHVGGDETPPDTVERIDFEDVSFAYENEPVLRDVSFAIEKGEFVSFVGQSGAGKSTMATLLARFYEPDSGTIRANGQPISKFDVTAWRSKIAFVRQDSHIFNDTLRYNVTIADPNASDAEIRRVSPLHAFEISSDLSYSVH